MNRKEFDEKVKAAAEMFVSMSADYIQGKITTETYVNNLNFYGKMLYDEYEKIEDESVQL